MKQKFTKQYVDKLSCTKATARLFVRDTVCRGLCVEVRSTGGKTYYLSYRDAQGKQRLYKLANAADVSPTQARQLCEQARRNVSTTLRQWHLDFRLDFPPLSLVG
jgi:hypothetical protein